MVTKVMAVQSVSLSEHEPQSPKDWTKKKSSSSFHLVLDKVIQAKAKTKMN